RQGSASAGAVHGARDRRRLPALPDPGAGFHWGPHLPTQATAHEAPSGVSLPNQVVGGCSTPSGGFHGSLDSAGRRPRRGYLLPWRAAATLGLRAAALRSLSQNRGAPYPLASRPPTETRRMTERPKVATCLWFDGAAEEAASFYTSLLPGSRIDSVMRPMPDA